MNLLNELGPSQHARALAIIHAVAREYELSPGVMMGRNKTRAVAEARQVAMYALRDQLGMTFVMIASIFGKKDHGCAIHACKQVESYLQTDRRFAERWPGLVRKILAARIAAENGFAVDYRKAVA